MNDPATPGLATPGSVDLRRAGERTRLAWRRTTLSAVTLVLVAAARLILGHASTGFPAVLGAVLMGLAVAGILGLAARRVNRLDRGVWTAPRHSPAALALLVAACALLGLLIIT